MLVSFFEVKFFHSFEWKKSSVQSIIFSNKLEVKLLQAFKCLSHWSIIISSKVQVKSLQALKCLTDWSILFSSKFQVKSLQAYKCLTHWSIIFSSKVQAKYLQAFQCLTHWKLHCFNTGKHAVMVTSISLPERRQSGSSSCREGSKPSGGTYPV